MDRLCDLERPLRPLCCSPPAELYSQTVRSVGTQWTDAYYVSSTGPGMCRFRF